MSWLFVILAFLLASVKSVKPEYQKVAVVVPAFNEEGTVGTVVEVIKKVSFVDEIIVVNDGSSDNTAEEALKAGARVVNHETNKGKGEALFTGYNSTNCDIIAFIDADIYNLTSKKVEAMIKPILLGKAEITKSKYARKSERVTELTAKPLLNYYFPEISFEQPLSGQFAARKEVLKKINFEKDYGVDVGFVIDAGVLGISIMEVDIGAIEYDMSPLENLNLMANEILRTIMDRANKYGRVTMIDDIGYYIRMSIVGLSLIILGLFIIFFVKLVPLSIGVIATIIGIVMTLYFIINVIVWSIRIYRKTSRGNVFRSFMKIHFPMIIIVVILLLMVSAFVGAATFSNGTISIEPNSRNLIIFSDDTSVRPVRAPYTIDAAFENESNMIRMPSDAMTALGVNVNDTIVINNQPYTINDTRQGESDILRLPIDVKNALNVSNGDLVDNGMMNSVFEGAVIYHNVVKDNITFTENFAVSSQNAAAVNYEVTVDNNTTYSSTAIFSPNMTYSIYANGAQIGSVYNNNSVLENQNLTYQGHSIEIEFRNAGSTSTKELESGFINIQFM